MRRLMQKHRNVSANGRCLVWIPTAMGQSIRTLSDALRDAKLIRDGLNNSFASRFAT
jgi:hypothetical protein